MTKWLTCNLTIYVTMVICLGLWSGHVSQTLSMDLSQEGFRFHRKQLKNGQGQLVPDTDRSALLEEDGADMDSLKEDSEDEELHDSDLDEGIYMPAVRPVSEHQFRMKMKSAQTYHDVLRIFLGESLTDFDIDQIMTTHRYIKQPLSVPGSTRTSIRKLPTKEDWKQWEKTKNETTEHAQCEEPVKEILRVRDITNKGDEIYYPECLVHYVCNVTSGCCGPRQQCGPDPDHIQEDVRAVMVMQFTGGTTDEMPDIHYLPVTNHMKCKCVDIPDSTWRPCPYPFNHSLHECRCVSSSHKDYCERIRRGKETLLSSDIECIVSGDCRPLDNSVCHFGPFDLEKRRCPTREESVDTGSGSVERKDTVKKRP